jgi:hypothetical protein
MKTFEELLEPYKENGRTIKGQMDWLRNRKGFAPNIVEQAIAEVYTEIDKGKSFADGNELDQYLLAKAKEIREEDFTASIDRMQKRLSSVIAKQPTGRWKTAWLALTGKLK